MIRVFQNGKVVYESPSAHEIRVNTLRNLDQLNPGYKRFHNPHQYHVSLSPLLFKIKQRLLRQAAAGEMTTASS